MLNPLLAEYHSYFTAAAPYEQPTLGAIGTIVAEQSAWQAALSSGDVTATAERDDHHRDQQRLRRGEPSR